MNIEALYQIYLNHPSVQTDTRKLNQGDLYFALKGESFDGNTFAEKALEYGAAFAIVDDPEYANSEKTILVDDVLKCLQDLALFHRNQFNIPFIAITGSNGKTTTKELVHTVLSTKFITYTTEGNLNNHIGIPLTILKIKKDAKIAVIEMGANHQREIASYCQYTLPTHGLINNCGKAHLEGFGGIEGVRKGKGELFDYLRDTAGVAFVNWDYDYLREMSAGISKIVKYGSEPEYFLSADILGSEPFLSIKINSPQEYHVSTNLVGDYNFPNVMAAVTVGKYFDVPDESIKQAIENYEPSNNRSQMVAAGSNHIIMDAYNANPSSMKAAIENFSKLHADKKVLMLGGMKEMGDETFTEHKALIDLIDKYEWHSVVLVGDEFKGMNHGYIFFSTSKEAREWFESQQFENTYFLIKGSRGIRMETIIENIKIS